MPNFDKEKLKLLTQLCKLPLQDEEMAKLAVDLEKILAYIEQLQEVDVSSLLPYAHLEEQGLSSLRPDTPQPPLSREAFLANAPEQVGGMIRVPPVIKQNP